jgi:hypothetical protein
MAVSKLVITRRDPYAEGHSFGASGPYERIDGTIGFAVAPAVAANAGIVDLAHAARDAAGLVRFEADFSLLQPGDPARGGRRLLFEVVNRGRRLAPRHLNAAPPEPVPTAAIDPGDGLLLREGWTLAWCGWQWDIAPSDVLLGLRAPEAVAPTGDALSGQTSFRFQPNRRAAYQPLTEPGQLPLTAADPHDPDAMLAVADSARGPWHPIPRERWGFASAGPTGPRPDPASLWLHDAFVPGMVYEVVYRTDRSPVVGAGLLAVRDTVAFLRHGDAAAGNPCAGRLDHTFGFGVSQSGRFLRHFLHLGLNLDEAGRQVFDGVLTHVAGGLRGQFNNRHGQPGVMNTPGFNHLPPHADAADAGPAGVFARQRAVGGMPRVIATNTAAEYWRGDAALIHLDPVAARDLTLPKDTRAYLLAGAQHSPGLAMLFRENPLDGLRAAHPFNLLDYTPLLRAALRNLAEWVIAGVATPPSALPRIADGTAVPATEALRPFAAIPGATVPDPTLLPAPRPLDLGPDMTRGIGYYPAVEGEPSPLYVAAVNADGNEGEGVLLPDLAVPIGTHSGWNPRDPQIGGVGQLVPLQGSSLPFARTATERAACADPRPALAERYRDRADYLARVRDAAETLPGDVRIGGATATNTDLTDAVYSNFPLMIALITIVTFLLLVRAFRSLLLPLKAVILNVLSVGAAYGVMVLVWQEGYGSEQIWGIESTGTIAAFVPILVFSFLFGLSMDYEVFILTRTREEYDATGSTDAAVIRGIGRTARLVTAAALILVLAFVAMGAAPDPIVKTMATGLAVGIFLDATVVRALLVPATVSLMGHWNWWLPGWLDRFMPVETASAVAD